MTTIRPRGRATICALAIAALAAATPSRAIAATVAEVVEEAAGSAAESAAAQERIDAIADDLDTLAADYRAALQTTRSLKVYNAQLETLLVSQRREIESLEKQTAEVTLVGRSVMPLMVRMIDALDAFVALDVPFLPTERRERIATLRAMMDRADVTIAEKYRRILEAFQIENEYGRTIEAYRGTLETEGASRTVDFLRIGRIALLYQTLDGQESGAWDRAAGGWTELSGYHNAIQQGIRVARKQVAPDLLTLPIPAAKELP
jgi:hypothetical protein